MEPQLLRQFEDLVKKNIGVTSYNRWFSQIKPERFYDRKAVLACPNTFVLDWVKLHYYPIIVKTIRELLGETVAVELLVKECPYDENGARINTQQQRSLPGTENYLNCLPFVNQGYSFSNFVVGPSNHLAYASALAITEPDFRRYNPFFIYSSEGLGKTHLSSAMGVKIFNHNADVKIFYTTAEWFTHEMIQALRKNRILEFKERYRKHCDVLFIEDIQFLQKKEKTQEEIFYTLNALIQMGKQVVLTANANPRELSDLKSNLKSQMGSGLVVDIRQPDYETRREIITKKCTEEKVEISDDAADFIARSITSNIRDLKSALIHVIATSSLLGQDITMDVVKESLKGFIEKAKVIGINEINSFIAQYFKISLDQLRSKSRSRTVTYPRQMSYYFCRKYTNSTLAEIGKCFNRNHSSVVRALNKFESSLRTNRSIRDAVDFLTEKFEKSYL